MHLTMRRIQPATPKSTLNNSQARTRQRGGDKSIDFISTSQQSWNIFVVYFIFAST